MALTPSERAKRAYDKLSSSPEGRAVIRSDRNSRNGRVRVWLAEYKMEKGCADCGYNAHPAALEFDHVRGEKLGNLATMQGMQKVQEEVLKCDVVCSNCHRIRTHVNQVLEKGWDYISHLVTGEPSSSPEQVDTTD